MKKILFLLIFCIPTLLYAQPGYISLVAGTWSGGYSGDGGPATAAGIGFTFRGAFDDDGNYYFASYESNNIRKISTDGIITTFAGSASVSGFSGDGGHCSLALFSSPGSIAYYDGALYVIDIKNYRIRKIVLSSGIITTIAGIGACGGIYGMGGPATAACLDQPLGICAGGGKLYIANSSDNCMVVYVINLFTERIKIYAGNASGASGSFGDGGPATNALLRNPVGLCFDASGNLLIAELLRIREVNKLTGIISTIAGTDETITDLADGMPALLSKIRPNDIGCDALDNIYLSENFSISGVNYERIRAIDPSTGILRRIVGNGTAGYSGDGDSAIHAKIKAGPLTVNECGDVYFRNEYRIRKVEFAPCTVAINHVNSHKGIFVYPNPATESLHIEGLQETTGYLLYSIDGKILLRGDMPPERSALDVTSLSPGMYLLVLAHSDGQKTTHKVLKQ